VPTIVFHGDRDTAVHPNNGDRIVEQSAKAAGLKAKVIDGRVPTGTPTPARTLPMWAGVTQAQARIRGAVTRNKKEKLTALLHHVSIDVLRWAFFNLKKRAAPGADGLTWADYAADLDRNLTDLHARVHSGAYRALPSRRKYIPKADGKQRPLGIAALEDKIIQAAVVAILTPIYEAEFLGFSYGFRPGRGQHDALDALAYGINARKINWILDADISRFFDTLSREWLIRTPNW
jgi:RNA-directed DNA polymerase